MPRPATPFVPARRREAAGIARMIAPAAPAALA